MFPGTHAIERAYAAYQRGEINRTGVMVHLVPDEGVDNGPVLGHRKFISSRVNRSNNSKHVFMTLNISYWSTRSRIFLKKTKGVLNADCHPLCS